jgi:hypothetical protein
MWLIAEPKLKSRPVTIAAKILGKDKRFAVVPRHISTCDFELTPHLGRREFQHGPRGRIRFVLDERQFQPLMI